MPCGHSYNYLSDSRAIQVKDLLNIVFLFLMETNMMKKKRPKSLNIEKNSVQTKKNNKDLVQQKTTIIKWWVTDLFTYVLWVPNVSPRIPWEQCRDLWLVLLGLVLTSFYKEFIHAAKQSIQSTQIWFVHTPVLRRYETRKSTPFGIADCIALMLDLWIQLQSFTIIQ